MTEIRTKARIFLAVVLPLVAVAAYVFLWRVEAAKKLEYYGKLDAELVDKADYPSVKARAERDLKLAEENLAKERATEMPKAKAVGDAADSFAKREHAFMEVLAGCGLRVVSCERIKAGDDTSSAVLSASGVCGNPVRCRFVVDGGYVSVVEMFDALSHGKHAVIVDSVSLEGDDRWTLEAVL